jgi:hypothetical protein
MDIHFANPEDIPQPPELIRFRDVSTNIYPDKRRIRVKVGVTPFQERPNLELEAFNHTGESVASASVIGMNNPFMELTLHIRGELSPGDYVLKLHLRYHDIEQVDYRAVSFVIPKSENHQTMR